KAWQAKMDNPAIVDTVAAKLSELNQQRNVLSGELAVAQREAASPLSESWGQFRSLADIIAQDRSDELRSRVRSALRRTIKSIHCLFTKHGRNRLAAVQVRFVGGEKRRDYLIMYRPPVCNGYKTYSEGAWWARSLAEVSSPDYDLRRPEDAK